MGFEIRNLTRDTMLCEKASLADGFWRRAKGLMFQTGWEGFDGLLLSPCRSIHTFGMGMEIDVCFLDPEQRIVKVLAFLKPWRAAHGGRDSRATLELPAGTLDRTGSAAGDRLFIGQRNGRRKTGGPVEGRRC